MKKYIMIMMLIFSSGVIFGQLSKKDSILRSVDAYRNKVFEDASIFIKNSNNTDERIKAIQNYAIIYDEKQKEQFKRIVYSENEKPEIRAIALNKIYDEAERDEKFFAQIIQWFASPKTPKNLRDETLNLIGNLSFSSIPGILEEYNTMVEDPDIVYREFAFSKLVINGDPRSQQLLIKGLEDSKSRLLDVSTSIRILSSAPKKVYYPSVYKLMLETQDENERLIAIQSLGGYQIAKDKLKSIFLSQSESSKFRESALVSFYSNNKNETIKYLYEILNDKYATSELKIIAIQLAINERKAMSYRKSSKKADNLDNLIREIANNKKYSDKNLVYIAEKYLLLVRPNF